MTARNHPLSPDLSPQFGVLLRQLRRRAGLTQAEFGAAVNLSTAQVSRLEQDERLPNVAAVAQQFVPALGLENDPRLAQRLVELAAAARGEQWEGDAVKRGLPPAPSTPGLPILPTRVIGRAAFLVQAQERLLEPDGRLLTLLGPPGIGKTTVALALAARIQDLFDHGAVFVGLAPIQDADQVAPTILQALGFSESSQGGVPRTQLIAYLRPKRMLLVLDNFEHLATTAAALIGELLAAAPGLTVLVTSRAPLRLRAERRLRVPPLPPEAAVELFVARAQAIEAEFALTETNRAVVADLCAGLDYLPLAIELAASRVDLLTPDELLAQAQENRLLATGTGAVDQEAHQQTLRAAIDRSYALLTPTEQQLFRILGVFVGGFDLAGVQALVRELGGATSMDLPPAAVAAPLSALVQRSLVSPSRREPGSARLFLLETLRAFAGEQLAAAGEQERTQAAHARMILDLAARAQANAAAAPQSWWSVLEENQENLRAALTWLLAHDRTAALQLAVRLHPYWELRGQQREGSQWLAQTMEPSADADLPRPLLAEALRKAGNFSQQLGNYPQAAALLAQAQEVYAGLGDEAGSAATLRAQGWLAFDVGEHAAAVAAFTGSLALYRKLGDLAMTARVLGDLVHVLGDPTQDYLQAKAYAAESLAIARRLDDSAIIAYALQQTGVNETRAGHYAEAAAAYTEALGLLRKLKAVRELGWALEQLGEALWHQGAIDAAHTYWTEALELFIAYEIDFGVMVGNHHLGQVARVQGRWDEALHRYAASLRAGWEKQNLAMVARGLAGMGGVLTARRRYSGAAQFLAVARRLIDELPTFLAPADERELVQLVDDLRAAVGDEVYPQLWAQGGKAGLEETVALALSLGGTQT